MDPLLALTYISVILMLGILCTAVASALRLPKTLVLILLGLTLGELVDFSGQKLINFDPVFIVGLATLAFILVVFDSTSRLRLREQGEHPKMVLKFIRIFMLFSIIGMTLFVLAGFFNSFTLSNIILAFMFSVLVIETDIGSVLSLVKQVAKERAGRILVFLETEADLNSAFIVIFPFLLIALVAPIDLNEGSFFSQLLSTIPYFLSQLLIAVGIGLVVGIVLLKSIRDKYQESFTPLIVFCAAVLAYVFARQLNGQSALAVATLGFLFGNAYVRGKEQLEEFSTMLSSAIEIMVYVVLGIVITIPLTVDFIGMSLILFLIFIAIRALAVFATLHDEHFRKDEKLFIALNMPKGMDLASVALLLSTFALTGLNVILPLIVAFIFYSLLFSYLADMYHHKLLLLKHEPLHAHHVPSAPAKRVANRARKAKSRKKR